MPFDDHYKSNSPGNHMDSGSSQEIIRKAQRKFKRDLRILFAIAITIPILLIIFKIDLEASVFEYPVVWSSLIFLIACLSLFGVFKEIKAGKTTTAGSKFSRAREITYKEQPLLFCVTILTNFILTLGLFGMGYIILTGL